VTAVIQSPKPWIVVAVLVLAVLAWTGLGSTVLGSPTTETSAGQPGPGVAEASSVPSSTAGPSSPAPTGTPESEGPPNVAATMAAHALAAAHAAGVNPDVVYIPRPSATPTQVADVEETGAVVPLYTANPAPMGVAYYGLSGTGTGTPTAATLTTTAIQGSVDVADVRGADLYQAAPDSFSIQLNAVLTGVTLLGNPSYTFWTQDIATYFPSSDTLMLVTNIWNFSGLPISSNALYATSGSFTTDDFSDYGTLGFYYSEYAVQGVTEPFDLTLEMQSTVDVFNGTTGLNEVVFGASLTSSTLNFNYPGFDSVVFDSSASPPYGTVPYGEPAPYTASGTALNPLGLTDDFELVICGPGGGSNVDLSAANAELGLPITTQAASSRSPRRTATAATRANRQSARTSLGATPLRGRPA